jgi:hypothetical protein
MREQIYRSGVPGSTARRDPWLRRALGLDALAVLALGALSALLGIRGDRRGPDDGFLADPAAAILALVTFGAAVAAGGVAAWALAREPPRSRPGRWGLGLALALVVSFPVLWALALALDRTYDWVGPFVPFQFAAGLGAAILGALAREPGRRGLLLIPFVIGTAALAFALGDMVVPTA